MAYAEKRGKGEYPWRVKFKRPDGEWDQASGFRTKNDALDHGRDQEAAARAGTWTDPRKAKTPLSAVADMFMTGRAMAPSTAATRRRFLRSYILPEYANTPVGEIKRWDVGTWAGKLPCAPATASLVVSFLSTLMNAAVDAELIRGNPIANLSLTRAGAQNVQAVVEERVWIYPEESIALADRLFPRSASAAMMLLVAAFTGARWGELNAFHVDNCLLPVTDTIDGRAWTRRVLRIDPLVGALHEDRILSPDGREHVHMYLGAPKPPNGARDLELPDFLADLLERHIESWRHPYPFCGVRGGFWGRGNWAKVFRPICDGRPAVPARQGRPATDEWLPLAPGLTIHGLRHGHKTAMEEDGVPDVLQDDQMGHGGRGPVQRGDVRKRYTHVTPIMRRNRLGAMTTRWEKGLGSSASRWS